MNEPGACRQSAPRAASSEPDRFSLKQEGSRFFEKKRRKKLLFAWAHGNETSTAQSQKVFLLLFVHKKKSSSSLKHAHPKPIMFQVYFGEQFHAFSWNLPIPSEGIWLEADVLSL
jgi:hypothetical protein